MIKANDLKKRFIKQKNKREKEVFYADNGISFEANDGENYRYIGT